MSRSLTVHQISSWVRSHRGGRLLPIATALPPPPFYHLLHPGRSMRNTSSPVPPPKGKAVPSRNPLFPDLGRAGSSLSFRPQAKCYLLTEASSSHFFLLDFLSHPASLPPHHCSPPTPPELAEAVMTGYAALPASCPTRGQAQKETSCVSHGHASVPERYRCLVNMWPLPGQLR